MPFPTVNNEMIKTGIADGNIPIIGAGNKLPGSIINAGAGANQILQVDGSRKIPAVDGSLLTNVPGSGGGFGERVLLETINASNSAEIIFSNFIDGIYKNYLVEMTSLQPSVSNVNLQTQVSSDGGATFLTGYDQHTQRVSNASPVYNAQEGNNNTVLTLVYGAGAYGTGSCHGHLIIHDPSVVQNHSFTGNMAYIKSGADAAGGAVYGERSGSFTINAIKFMLSAGNFVQGIFKLYGLS